MQLVAGKSTDEQAAVSAPAASGSGGAPRLTSEQIAQFVARGYLRFDGLVGDEVNRIALAELRGESSFEGLALPPIASQRYEPGTPLAECFKDSPGVGSVLALPQVRGIIESLVGPDPFYDHHAVHVRRPGEPSQPLHGDAIIDTRAAFDIQLMYYPEAVTARGGGTLFVPGSHFRQINEQDVARYQNLAGTVLLDCPAGTVLALHHGMWHCGRRTHADKVRYMFKLRLNPAVEQVGLWDTSDLRDEAVRGKVKELLAETQPWYEGATARLEQLQRTLLFRRLSGEASLDLPSYWAGRLENQARPHLRELLG
jgi:hypothetical protein